LSRCRNDLGAPAIALMPAIAEILAALEGAIGSLLSRVSGSGPTCFGLFAQAEAAASAAQELGAAHPDWWVVATPVLKAFDPALAPDVTVG
jgi:4-diphosphocytidyl-2-C-methyl-D-erythritol kinase